MARLKSKSISVPYLDKISNSMGLLSDTWSDFFRNLYDLVSFIGFESYFQIENDQTGVAVEGLQFDFRKTNQAYIDYVIQRITSGVGATELLESCTYIAVYKPNDESWSLFKMGTSGPNNSGVTFSIDDTGQVFYSSSNMTGTVRIHNLTYRTRTMAAKVIKPSGGWT